MSTETDPQQAQPGEEQIDYNKQLRDVFKEFDADGSGNVSSDELTKMFQQLGVDPDPAMLKELLEKYDDNHNGQLEFREFSDLARELLGWPADEESERIRLLREVFDQFDADGSGNVSSAELSKMMTELGAEPDEEALQELLLKYDENQNGELEFGEFSALARELLGWPAVQESAHSKQLRNVFQMFDTDNSGKVSVEELSKMMTQLGQDPNQEAMQGLLMKYDENKNGELEFWEFSGLARELLGWPAEEDEYETELTFSEKDMKEAFAVFDQDKSGSISTSEFRYILMKLCATMHFIRSDIDDMVKYADKNGDGDINFSEFCQLLN